MKKLAFLFLIALFAACSDDDKTEPCTTEFVAGLRVDVLFGVTPVGEGITVTATDGDYIEELVYTETTFEYEGAYERPGTYTITVTGDGYQPYVSEPITVTEDACHVQTQEVSISLAPEE